MLTLDQTTLFYLSLMNSSAATNQKIGGLISTWAAGVESQPSSKASKSTNGSIRSLPPLTQGSTQSSSASVLTNTVVITSSAEIHDGPDQYPDGIPDEDKINGPEQDTAISSPPKGKK